MANRISSLQALNARRGFSVTVSISIEADATYNNRLASGCGKTPFHPPHVLSLLTKEKQIIATTVYSSNVVVENKGIRRVAQQTLPKPVIGGEGKYLNYTLRDIFQWRAARRCNNIGRG